eukprot:m.45904 g.45904  ORF g.45904 m.45904 type:complete len:552 (+) comp5903_c0_seq1:436-2091(+)
MAALTAPAAPTPASISRSASMRSSQGSAGDAQELLESLDLLTSIPRPGGSVSRRSSGTASNESFRRREESEDPLVDSAPATFPLPVRLSTQITRHAIDWSLLHGLVVNFGDRARPNYQHVPIALLPSPYPTRIFDEAVRVQMKINQLFHSLQFGDYDFLATSLHAVAEKDEFIAKLLRISRAVRNEGPAQNVSLSIHRIDYVLHLPTAANSPVLRIAAAQTMSAAFPALGSVVSDLHAHMASRFPALHLRSQRIPHNNGLSSIVDVFARTVSTYGAQFSQPLACLAMLVIENTAVEDPGSLELRMIENALWERYHITVLRRSFQELYAEVESLGDGRSLVLGEHEVALVYFRYGGKSTDYASSSDWSTRLLLERSRAIKCPSIANQLAGHRHLLHVLSRPGVLDNLMPEAGDLQQALQGIHMVPVTPDGMARVADIAEEFLLQSSLRSSTNLLSGVDLVDSIVAMRDDERALHALLERPRPPMQRNYLVQNGSVSLGNVVSELGVFGAVLSESNSKMLHSSVLGHVLRSKMTDEDGGMSAGLAVLDSPYLV